MTRITKNMLGAAAVAAILGATPAAAQYGGYDPRHDPYYDRRDDGFDIAAGIAVVGTIANILQAFRGGGRYGYPGAYGSRGYGGYSYDYSYAVNGAVNSCGRHAQRVSGGGRVEIRDVDQVSNGRFRVRGAFDDLRNHDRWSNRRVDRDRFSCLVWGDGRIQDFDIHR